MPVTLSAAGAGALRDSQRARRPRIRPGNPQFPFPRFPIWPGNGEGNPRFPTRPESGIGNPRFPIRPGTGIAESGSRLAANREIGDTPLCEYSSRDPGLDVALSP